MGCTLRRAAHLDGLQLHISSFILSSHRAGCAESNTSMVLALGFATDQCELVMAGICLLQQRQVASETTIAAVLLLCLPT